MTKYLTQKGLEKLKKELEYLENTKRKEVSEQLGFYASLGDFKENSAYDSAKEEQGLVEDRIAELKEIINQTEIIKIKGAGKVQIGSIVLVSCNNKKEKFQIVEPEETDVENGKLSYKSPLGRMLLDKKKNQMVRVEAPVGKMDYKIIEVA